MRNKWHLILKQDIVFSKFILAVCKLLQPLLEGLYKKSAAVWNKSKRMNMKHCVHKGSQKSLSKGLMCGLESRQSALNFKV